MWSRASLKTKLMLSFLSVTAFMVIVAGLGYFSIREVNREYSFIAKDVINNLKNTGTLGDVLRDMQRSTLRTTLALDEADRKKFQENWYKDKALRDTTVTSYLATEFIPGEKVVWDAYVEAFEDYSKVTQEYFRLINLNDPDAKAKVREFLDKDVTQSYFNVRDSLNKVWNFHESISAAKAKDAAAVYEKSTLISAVISLVGIVFALTVGIFFSNYISNVVTNITKQLFGSAEETSQGSNQLTSASSQLSQGATESAASLEETVSSLEELSSMVKLNSDHAKEANALSQKSLQSAEVGDGEMNKLISAMANMSKSSKKIEEIINVIDDVAFQTNLLALNAAVEAARAGEQGKGFAVVADAVRNLAQRSASAAKDINTLIKENVEMTEHGVKIADSTGSSLKEIVTSVKKVADLNSEISAASQEQANGIEQISKAMNHLDQAIQTNASSSEEVASSAEEMSSQAECLKDLVSDLRIFIAGKDQDREAARAPRSSEYKSSSNVHPIKKSARRSARDILPLDDGKDSLDKAEGF